MANKDLDLPTQQVLLAQYRCDEIAQVALATFDAAIKPLEAGVRTDAIQAGLGGKMGAARRAVLGEFEEQGQRYHKETFRRKAEDLKTSVDLRLQALFRAQIAALHTLSVRKFEEGVESALRHEDPFSRAVAKVRGEVVGVWEREASEVLVEGTGWTFAMDREVLLADIDSVTARLRKEEISRVIEKFERDVKNDLEDPVAKAFATPSSTLWDRIIAAYSEIEEAKTGEFKKAVGELGTSGAEVVEESLGAFRKGCWSALRDRLDGECEPTHLLLRLRET